MCRQAFESKTETELKVVFVSPYESYFPFLLAKTFHNQHKPNNSGANINMKQERDESNEILTHTGFLKSVA